MIPRYWWSILLLLLWTARLNASFWGYEGAREDYLGHVWSADLPEFRAPAYMEAVAKLLTAFEEDTTRALVPGVHRRVALKVYTNSGEGLTTPPALVRAVVRALEDRGFDRTEMFLVDLHENRLREAGFLPPLSEYVRGQTFEGVPVLPLDDSNLISATWYYESPLPPEIPSRWGAILFPNRLQDVTDPERRKSFLPADLLTDVDFWINLPVGVEVPTVGVSGALANATLWNITNRDRFFVSPANAPVAMAEIAAIPELQAHWAVTILSLEKFQFIGGPPFNAYYTRSENKLLLSADPIALDMILLDRFNDARIREGFDALPVPLPSMIFAEELGVGEWRTERLRIEELQ